LPSPFRIARVQENKARVLSAEAKARKLTVSACERCAPGSSPSATEWTATGQNTTGLVNSGLDLIFLVHPHWWEAIRRERRFANEVAILRFGAVLRLFLSAVSFPPGAETLGAPYLESTRLGSLAKPTECDRPVPKHGSPTERPRVSDLSSIGHRSSLPTVAPCRDYLTALQLQTSLPFQVFIASVRLARAASEVLRSSLEICKNFPDVSAGALFARKQRSCTNLEHIALTPRTTCF
jgi:hypothetical protein